MLRALVAGERDPEVLAELSKGRLRKKIPELRQALRGRFRDHHALLIGLCLEHTAHLEAAIATLDGTIDGLFAVNTSEAGVPFERARDRLTTIDGVGKRAAEIVIAEIGADMSRFPTAAHLASWAGMAPGTNITGGKRLSGKTTKGDVWLRDISRGLLMVVSTRRPRSQPGTTSKSEEKAPRSEADRPLERSRHERSSQTPPVAEHLRVVAGGRE